MFFNVCTRRMRFPPAFIGLTSCWRLRNCTGGVNDQRLLKGGMPPSIISQVWQVTLAFVFSVALLYAASGLSYLGDLLGLDSFARLVQIFEGDLQVRALQRDHRHCTHPCESLESAKWHLQFWR